MIAVKINSDLDQLFGEIGTMYNDVVQVVTDSITQAVSFLNEDIHQSVGGGYGEIIIDMNYTTGEYLINVDGINEYQLLNTTGMNLDSLADYVEQVLLDYINDGLDRAGY